MFTLRTCRPLAILGMLAVGLLLMAPPTTAAPSAEKKLAKEEIIAELHATKVLLELADHDYDGHRAKAVEEVSHAIHELEGGTGKRHHHHHEPGVSGTGEKKKEPQEVSDKQLRQALEQLRFIAGQLGNHPKPHANVQNAIGELEIALKIK